MTKKTTEITGQDVEGVRVFYEHIQIKANGEWIFIEPKELNKLFDYGQKIKLERKKTRTWATIETIDDVDVSSEL